MIAILTLSTFPVTNYFEGVRVRVWVRMSLATIIAISSLLKESSVGCDCEMILDQSNDLKESYNQFVVRSINTKLVEKMLRETDQSDVYVCVLVVVGVVISSAVSRC